MAGDDTTCAACAICHGATRRVFERHGFWIRECDSCRHRFAENAVGDDHVARVYDDRYFSQGAEGGYADYLAERSIMMRQAEWYSRLLDRHVPCGSLLEVGCAAGFWLDVLKRAGWEARGLEPNPTMSAHARDELGLDVVTGSLESWQPDRTFDLVAMIQVVAHFHDVERAFEVAALATAAGGHWLVETWDCGSLTARLFGKRWHEYSPPSVLHWFTRDTLVTLARRFGFEPVGAGRPAKGIDVGHARSLLRYKARGSRLARVATVPLALLPDRLRFPYLMDDLFWMLLRKE